MKRILFSTLLLASMTASAQQVYQYTTVPNDPMKTRIYTLNNGLKVYLSVNPEQPRIAAHIAVNTGHRNDPAETTGLAHYLEHLMFKGSTNLGTTNYQEEKPYLDKITSLYEEYRVMTDPAARKAKYHEIDSLSQIAAKYNIPNEYDKVMASIGGNGSNAYTSFDVTCYTENIPANEVENWAKIQSDRFKNMVIRGFHTELETVYEEKNMSLVRDDEKAQDALFAKLFPSHSYGTQTTIGTQEHLKNPSIINIKNYFNKYYVPNNVAICMSGDMNPDEVIATLDKYFNDWKVGTDTTPRQFPKQPTFTVAQDTTVVGQERESLMMAWRFEGAKSHQCDTLALASSVLCNGKVGLIDLDLNQKMRVMSGSAGAYNLKDYSMMFLEGMPNEGQTLEEVRALLLEQVARLKKGEFEESLLTSIINNAKLSFNQRIESNRGRVGMMTDSFINGESWEDIVSELDRLSKITKQDVVDFANKYLTDGYVCVYKRQGEDKNIVKIEKPAITPIPANRQYHSAFLDAIAGSQVPEIQPVFVDYQKDLSKGTTKSNLPLVYKKNETNELFTLVYFYDFGSCADNRYDIAADYLDLLGTKLMTNEQLKKEFFNLACSYNVNIGTETTQISLSGLSENMEKAVKLLDDFLQNAQPDQEAYQMYVGQILKNRQDAKSEQRANFSRLSLYGQYGERNAATDVMSAQQLQETNPQVYTDLMKGLSGMKHQVLYYGPATLEQVDAIVSANHTIAKDLKDVPANNYYVLKETPTNQVLLAPYEANNIYLQKYHNEGRQWKPEYAPVETLFNEYYGGGMNGIVFQEMREARGLAYSARASYLRPARLGVPESIQATIISQNDKMMDCINTFAEIMDEMPQSEGAFQLAKQSALKNLASTRTTKIGVLNSYLSAQKLGLDYDINKPIYEQIQNLTLQDIVKFEKEQVANKPWTYLILGNEKELDMNALQKVGNIQRLTTDQIFGY